MKDRQQVKEFITTITAKDLANRIAIEHDCQKDFKLNVKIPVKEQGLTEIGYEEFLEWIDKETPKCGDVIKYPASKDIPYTIAIVQSIGYNCIHTAATLIDRKHLSYVPSELPIEGFQTANKEEIKMIMKSLSINNLQWSTYNKKIIEKFIPNSYAYIKIKDLDGKRGIGILREIKEVDGKKQIIMFCVQFVGQPLQHSFHVNIGNLSEWQLNATNDKERSSFDEELKKIGKVWNVHLRRLEPSTYRLNRGEEYYHLDQNFSPTRRNELSHKTDKRRYDAGNYFTSHDECKAFSVVIRELRKRILATGPDMIFKLTNVPSEVFDELLKMQK